MDQMLETIEQLMALYTTINGTNINGSGSLSPRIRQALKSTPRAQFVPNPMKPLAFADRPQPIGHGQTISQPFIVALMTELLEPAISDRVLEIGTGSGYQAAVLAQLVEQLYSIEVIPQLAQEAGKRLAALGYRNVLVLTGNGADGHPAAAPYDKIIITAACEAVPTALREQLRPGGLMVAPVGPLVGPQQLTVLRKSSAGAITHTPILAVNFVPFTQIDPTDR